MSYNPAKQFLTIFSSFLSSSTESPSSVKPVHFWSHDLGGLWEQTVLNTFVLSVPTQRVLKLCDVLDVDI